MVQNNLKSESLASSTGADDGRGPLHPAHCLHTSFLPHGTHSLHGVVERGFGTEEGRFIPNSGA